MNVRNVPNFIGVGTGRAGTTLAFSVLQQSTEFYLPQVKEINYFGVFENSLKRPHGWSVDTYLRHFLRAGDERWLGEISPVYFSFPASLKSIKRLNPDMRILVFLRNPVQRSLSHYHYHQGKHGEANAVDYFGDALERCSITMAQTRDWFSPEHNLRQSLYSSSLEAIFDEFRKEQVSVFVYEDLLKSPMNWKAQLESFFEVDLDPQLFASRVNASVGEKADFSQSLRARLAKFFEPDVIASGKILGRDLSKIWSFR